MWEAIRSNRWRSRALIGAMGALLVTFGFVIGAAIDPRAGGVGAIAALGVWLVLLVVAFAGGDQILLSSVGAREVSKQDAPRLWNVVEEMSIAAGLGGAMPRVFIIDDDAPNAFAVGRNPRRAAVAVTSGLLSRLNRDELQGVIGHEIGHVVNLDIRFMTLAGVMVGSIVLIADVFLRAMFYGGGRRRSSSRDGGGQAQAIMLVVAIAMAILAPIFAQLLYYACSRRREYLADASSARFTRYPAGLASALEKIAAHAPSRKTVNRAVSPLYTVNPVASLNAASVFATHPPIASRVKILRAMGGAGFADYDAAFRKVEGDGCLSRRTLESADATPLRAAAGDTGEAGTPSQQDAVDRAREAVDLVDRLVANYIILPCACGLRIKVPPASAQPAVRCPRCGRRHVVPRGESH